MARRTLASFLLVLGFLQKGLTALVETQQEVTAALGEDARLTCWLTQTKDVVQITWQKLHPMENLFLASYSKEYGERPNPELKEKVAFAEAELQRSSIVLKNLTEEDEGCYRCVFNADPEGALTGRTCLHLYELHAPVLSAAGSDSTVVSCWATGRPAPSLTLTVLQEGLHLQPNATTTSVTNSNGTVTVNRTVVLSGHRGKGSQVLCMAQVLSGSPKRTEMLLPDEVAVEKRSSSFSYIYNLLIAATVILLCICICLAIFLKKFLSKNKSSQPEKSKTPNKGQEAITTSRTPLMEEGRKEAHSGLFRRTPSKTSPSAPRLFKPKSLFLNKTETPKLGSLDEDC